MAYCSRADRNYLADEICQNAWVLAYFTFSRFAYLILLFPLIVKFGRKVYDGYRRKVRKQSDERAVLIPTTEEDKEGESNHFDVRISSSQKQ